MDMINIQYWSMHNLIRKLALVSFNYIPMKLSLLNFDKKIIKIFLPRYDNLLLFRIELQKDIVISWAVIHSVKMAEWLRRQT
jgi:hypothetical protein